VPLQMESPTGMDLSQIAILITGREHDQPYEWSLHELQALSVSLDPAVIDVIKRKQPSRSSAKRKRSSSRLAVRSIRLTSSAGYVCARSACARQDRPGGLWWH